MMLEKPNPTEVDDFQPVDSNKADDREKDIERRLALLGGMDQESPTIVESTTEPTEPAETRTEMEPLSKEVDLMSFDPHAAKQEVEASESEIDDGPTSILSSDMNITSTGEAEEVKPDLPQANKQTLAPALTNKNALLARIMAAQQKAKLVQTSGADQPIIHKSNSSTTKVDKNEMLKQLETNETVQDTMPPPSFPTMTEDKDLPPPPFELIDSEVQQRIAKENEFSPPPFESVESDILQFTGVPSAPPVEENSSVGMDQHNLLEVDHLDGVTPVMLSAPPVERDEVGKKDLDTETLGAELFDFELEGEHLSQEDKLKMMEEQRRIMEEIKRSTVEDTASVLAAKATAFDLKSNAAAAAAAAATSNESSLTPQVASGYALDESADQSADGRTVDIGGGQKVALYGQSKTREAIKDGTATLVECPNCQSWMQVAATATLMFCPLCSTVSPVVKEGEIMSKEEVEQIETDRQLAERLQNMENEQSSSSGEQNQYGEMSQHPAEGSNKSWWDTFSDAFTASTTTNEHNEDNYAAVSTTAPPGAASVTNRTSLHNVNTGAISYNDHAHDSNFEQERLLGDSSRNSSSFPTGRVAERKPLFSCVVDGISSTATALGTSLGATAEEDSNVHGIDTTSLLAVPKNTGRGS